VTTLTFDGLLYFPLTAFGDDGEVDLGAYQAHLEERLSHGPGGVFPACGTGEYHALSAAESAAVVERTVKIVRGAMPVVAGVGGSIADARVRAAAAEDAGADALLVLPPYLVQGPASGAIAYVRGILDATDLPVIVYNRGTARFPAAAAADLFADPRVVGFKDGVGDVAEMQKIVRAAASRDDIQFFNGLLTAEMSQGAYRGIGVPLYSSAAFAMAPEVAVAFYGALESEDDALRFALLDEFFAPLVTLRDEVPGFGVSLIKAGARLRGERVGPVRAPLVDPDETQLERLRAILAAGERLVAAP
jgi:5-dehydro-4-deoxyglucarate dehydratase